MTGAFLSNHDIKHLQDTYGNKDGMINYEKMSNELGLHQTSFAIMRQTHSKINRLKSAGRQFNQSGNMSVNRREVLEA